VVHSLREHPSSRRTMSPILAVSFTRGWRAASGGLRTVPGMQRRLLLTLGGAAALTLAASLAAMAANLGILDHGSGVDIGDLSPVGSSTSITTPVTAVDGTVSTPSSGVSLPTSVDDHGVDNPAEHEVEPGHDDGIPGDANDDDAPRATTPATGTTPTTIEDHAGVDDNRGPGSVNSGPGSSGSDDSGSGGGSSGSGHGRDD
jgi:hypothetical protein